jgi:leucyl aminopeptidase
VEVQVSSEQASESSADLVCLGLFDGDELPGWLEGAPGAVDVKTGFKKLTMVRPPSPARVLVAGLGSRDEFEPERARVAAALAQKQAARYDASSLAWALPGAGDPAASAAALVEGTVLASFRFDEYRKSDEPPATLEQLTLIAPEGDDALAEAAKVAMVASEATNRARTLQSLPANHASPEYLAGRAAEIGAEHESVTAEILDLAEIRALGMGGLVSVGQGSAREPKLIVLRYAGGTAGSPPVAIVGKAVTFDTGGISIKPSGSMHEMKMDMSGGAAALEGTAAIAALGIPVNLLTVIPATENMPSGTATRPGDIITQYNGKTVEVINTDAEGRLILADALAWAVEQGADRVIDLATLTGAVLIALGSTYTALVANDDEWAEAVASAGNAVGELAWRLPLHREYKELTEGTISDLVNASAKRKAGTIYAASFLEEFVGEAKWAHLDIAGTAWDTGRAYVGRGPTGVGVRTLVELARRLAP